MKAQEINKLVKEAIKEFKIENLKEQKKQVYHNTRLLLKRYKDLKQHVDSAIDEINQIEPTISELDEDELYILSIKRSKAKTLIMIAHIDVCLELLKQKQIEKGCIEKYEVLEKFYIQEIKYEDLVKQYYCGVNAPRRWMNEMIEELSVYLFGIDGVKIVV